MKRISIITIILIVAVLLGAFILDDGDPEPVPTMPLIVVTATVEATEAPPPRDVCNTCVDTEGSAPQEPTPRPTPTSPTDDPAFWWTPTPGAYPAPTREAYP